MFFHHPAASLALTLLLGAGFHADSAHELPPVDRLPAIATNDNRQPAGTRQGDVLTLQLRASRGLWRPEGPDGPALEIEAFGELNGRLQIPSPLIRVPEGTQVVARVRNDLQHPLRVHGLCARDGSACAPLEIAPASEREVRFAAGRPGTYHYWATTTGMPLPFRGTEDTQLSGAFVVDPAGASANDRVLVITDWTSLNRAQLKELAAADDPGVKFFALEPRFAFMINGLSWPTTERLTYRLGEDVRWRVVNLSSQPHPMHLHGFYFALDGLGDGLRDTTFEPAHRRRMVTQLLGPGATMAMTWRAEREGKWVFHCHISEHISPERRIAPPPDAGHAHAGHDGATDAAGMSGLILGVTIVKDQPGDVVEPTAGPPRAMTLTMRTEEREGARPVYGFALSKTGEADPGAPLSVPGPMLVLERGRPVEIALVNRLPEATAIHWHGMELESYYDGVHGWSGVGSRVTPLVAPGSTFVVRFTPPRTGTFIYHTHLHDDRQLTSGMYGGMVVVEPGETFDPDLDHVVVIGRSGPERNAPALLNGSREPLLVWKAGARHRVRFVNITPGDIFAVSLTKGEAPIEWRPVTKDGAPLPAADLAARPASQTIAVGETYDFEIDAPPGRHALWLNVRTPGGRWIAQGRIVIK